MPAELLRDRIGTTMRLAPGPSFNEAPALAEFREGIEQCLVSKDLWVAVDLDLVSHLGSAALEALVDAHHALAARGGSLSLLNVNALNSDILQLCGIDEYVEFISAAPPPPRTNHAGARLGDLLVEQGLVSEDQVAEAIRLQSETGKKMGRVLVERGAELSDRFNDAFDLFVGVDAFAAGAGGFAADVDDGGPGVKVFLASFLTRSSARSWASMSTPASR